MSLNDFSSLSGPKPSKGFYLDTLSARTDEIECVMFDTAQRGFDVMSNTALSQSCL